MLLQRERAAIQDIPDRRPFGVSHERRKGGFRNRFLKGVFIRESDFMKFMRGVVPVEGKV